MKKIIVLGFVVITALLAATQMVIHLENEDPVSFNIEDIDNITFEIDNIINITYPNETTILIHRENT